MYEQSNDIGELATALAKAQGEVQKVDKDSKNPHYRSTYASLAAVMGTVLPVLSKHGIAMIQLPGGNGEVVEVTTQLTHSSGQWIRCTVAARPMKNDPQGVGSAVTYLRRYGAMAMAGVAPEDDDGEAASSASPAPRVALHDESAHPRDNKEVARIVGLMEACADAEELRIIGKEEGVREWANARERAYMLSAAKRIAAGFGA